MKKIVLVCVFIVMAMLPTGARAQIRDAKALSVQLADSVETAELNHLIRQAMALELSRLDRLLPTLFPDTRNPELIRLKTGFEKNFFLSPRIDRVDLIAPEGQTAEEPGGQEKQTACTFERIDIYLDGRSLVKKLHFSKSLISFEQPRLDRAALTAMKLKPFEPIKVHLFLEAPFTELAAFIVRECRRNGATVPDLFLKGKEIKARGRLRVLFFNLDLEARGAIYLDVSDRSVRFRARRVAIGRFSLPRFLYRSLMNEFNPAFRFEPLIFELQPASLQFEGETVRLVLEGKLLP